MDATGIVWMRHGCDIDMAHDLNDLGQPFAGLGSSPHIVSTVLTASLDESKVTLTAISGNEVCTFEVAEVSHVNGASFYNQVATQMNTCVGLLSIIKVDGAALEAGHLTLMEMLED